MKRRNFLKALGLGSLSLFVPKIEEPEVPEVPVVEEKIEALPGEIENWNVSTSNFFNVPQFSSGSVVCFSVSATKFLSGSTIIDCSTWNSKIT